MQTNHLDPAEAVPIVRIDEIDWHPRDAVSALASLDTVVRRLNAVRDARATFLDIYAVVTRLVVRLLDAPGASGFLEPEWLSHLTGRFAEEALIAVRDSLLNRPLRSAAWRFATYYPAARITQPYQDALLGVSAHINHDLALVCFETIAREDPARLPRFRHDYFKVNEILETCLPECVDLLAGEYGCSATQGMLRLPLGRAFAERAVMRLLIVWRARVWTDIEALLAAPDHAARQRIAARIDLLSGRYAQGLCSKDALRELLRGRVLPFRLSRSPTTWPDVQAPLLGAAVVSPLSRVA
jgi:hypothetical protein